MGSLMAIIPMPILAIKAIKAKRKMKTMKKITYINYILGLICFAWSIKLPAQASINANNRPPDPSAMLDIQSSNRGFLMPRMTESDRLAITSPANGLFLFQTDNNKGFYYNEGSSSLPAWASVAIQTSELICDQRIPIDSVLVGSNYRINESGSYYLTSNITITFPSLDGIVIAANNVSLDLNGYTLNGSNAGDDGIFVLTDLDNIIIKNGIVEDWAGDGINALNADQSIFVDLKVRNNGGDGIVADFNCLIHRCVAEGNGFDGLEVDDGGIISNSTASNNEDNGIQSSEGTLIINCTSFGNAFDGIDAASGSRIESCTAYENGYYGIDLGLGGQVINCVSNRNRSNGIDLASSCIAINNIANDNGRCWLDGGGCNGIADDGAGIRAFTNAQLINNTCNDNIMGIRISSTDTYVADNYVEGNRHAGIAVTRSGCLIIRNRASNNGFSTIQGLIDAGDNPSGNITIDPNSTFGPIIDVSAAGNILNTAGAAHPYANFIY